MKVRSADYDTRIEQTRELEKLEHHGITSVRQLERAQVDTERMAQEIRQMNTDATQEDMRNTLSGIERVQTEVLSHIEAVLTKSTEVRDRMNEFEDKANAAAERARQDQEGLADLIQQHQFDRPEEAQIEILREGKVDSQDFQYAEAKLMNDADTVLKRIMEQTRDAVARSLGRMG